MITIPTLLMLVALVLFGVAVFQSKGKSVTAWAFFLAYLAYTWAVVTSVIR